jgi:HupE/UreJ protein
MTHRSRALAILRRPGVAAGAVAMLVAIAAGAAHAHGISGDDQDFLLRSSGPLIGPYVYLGAKHMVTGYDHLLFLAGVIFFLYRLKDVATYVTLFAIGHSVTLLLGVLGGLHVNSYLVDAVIGLSVVYKAFENLGGFSALGFQPNMKAAVLVFGFFHGFGLATKLQDLAISPDGLVTNMISFNVGVELGQLLALSLILLAFNAWRTTGGFFRHAYGTNVALMTAGFVLAGYQLTGYFVA